MALSRRIGTLLVAVPGLSGIVYPEGTRVTIQGTGGSVDGFVDGDWLPLAWWEFADVRPEDGTG
ncbi:hypothetical protein [Streptomyces coeruleorubidus]|uniref:hypothetical protein n=1 Tax=Streptomyces coeruleorubidus TaxID=116188 RepID=UPI00364B1EE1